MASAAVATVEARKLPYAGCARVLYKGQSLRLHSANVGVHLRCSLFPDREDLRHGSSKKRVRRTGVRDAVRSLLRRVRICDQWAARFHARFAISADW